VNKGAELVILADNTAYLSPDGANSCPNGYFNGGCVEVMAGGKLRDGAYEGFPLGSNAVILNRFNSYLSVGPEESSTDAKKDDNLSDTYKLYYQGYLLAPADLSLENVQMPRIEWNKANNTDSSYLEVRPGQIATDGIFTVKKSLGLIYSVWFVGNASITIDVATGKGWGSGETEQRGLFSNESADNNDSDYRFYANTVNTVITIAQGSMFDKRYLVDGVKKAEASDIIAASTGSITIAGTTTGPKVEYADGTGIFGYLIPPPTEENDD
jgi:hypothetical protein